MIITMHLLPSFLKIDLTWLVVILLLLKKVTHKNLKINPLHGNEVTF